MYEHVGLMPKGCAGKKNALLVDIERRHKKTFAKDIKGGSKKGVYRKECGT
jgi:hypothetical protein